MSGDDSNVVLLKDRRDGRVSGSGTNWWCNSTTVAFALVIGTIFVVIFVVLFAMFYLMPHPIMARPAASTVVSDTLPAVKPPVPRDMERWWAERHQTYFDGVISKTAKTVQLFPQWYRRHRAGSVPQVSREPLYYTGGCPLSVCLPKRTGD